MTREHVVRSLNRLRPMDRVVAGTTRLRYEFDAARVGDSCRVYLRDRREKSVVEIARCESWQAAYSEARKVIA